MATLAFIGVGRMGSRMAQRLLDAGHDLRVYDPSPTATQALGQGGATVCADPAEAAKGADIAFTSLPTPAVLRAVITGDGGLTSGDLSGTTVIDMSTVDPSTTREMAAAVQAAGGAYLDAPVSGGVSGAAAGTLVLMVGGEAAVLDGVRAELDVIAARIVHCGPVGAGQLTKLSHNLLTAINTVAAGEVLAATVRAGADLDVLLDVFDGGLAGSKMLTYFRQTVLTEERPPNFPIDLMHKDISLCLEEFAGTPMPLGQLVLQTYNAARVSDLGAKDSTSVVELYERLLGVTLSTTATEADA